MKTLNKTCSRTMDQLTADLVDPSASDGKSSRHVDRTKGFLRVCVERIGPTRYSVAHYIESNGDLCADPEIEFLRLDALPGTDTDRRWVPCARTLLLDGRREVIVCDPTGKPARIAKGAQADLVGFANMMLRNIVAQQCINPRENLPLETPKLEAIETDGETVGFGYDA